MSCYNISGTAGDSFIAHDGQKFSTQERDNDNDASINCAMTFHGAWWYHWCHNSNLNGLYLRGNRASYANGVNWLSWRGHYYSLKRTEMKIRPRNF